MLAGSKFGLDIRDKLSIHTRTMKKQDQIDALAAELGVSYEARMKWRQRGHVPGKWHLRLMRLAERKGIRLTSAHLLFSPHKTGREVSR